METRERDLLALETQENWWVRPKGMTYNPTKQWQTRCYLQLSVHLVSSEPWRLVGTFIPLSQQQHKYQKSSWDNHQLQSFKNLFVSRKAVSFHACTYLWVEPERPIQHQSSEWGQLLLENSCEYVSSHSKGSGFNFSSQLLNCRPNWNHTKLLGGFVLKG